jgi:hypothetical protein
MLSAVLPAVCPRSSAPRITIARDAVDQPEHAEPGAA